MRICVCLPWNEAVNSVICSLPNGVPSTDTFERVFGRIHPAELECCLRSYGKDILNDLSEEQIVIDGKKLYGASPTSRGNKGFYILNAWVSENRFCIAQEKMEDKSNEITTIPEILPDIDISDAVVSIDDMETQREIAELFVQSGGHYLLAVEEIQRSLCEDMECAFRVKSHTVFYEEVDVGHGRIETRRCSILPARDFLMEETLESWKNLSTFVKIESIREIKDRITRDVVTTSVTRRSRKPPIMSIGNRTLEH